MVSANSMAIPSAADIKDRTRLSTRPGFGAGFPVLAGLGLFGLIPFANSDSLSWASRWLLPVAIAAVHALLIAGVILAGIKYLT